MSQTMPTTPTPAALYQPYKTMFPYTTQDEENATEKTRPQELRRNKRGLFDFRGEVLFQLFGSARNSDFEQILKQLQSVYLGNRKLVHVVHSQLSLIHQNLVNGKRNAAAIRKMSQATQLLIKQLTTIFGQQSARISTITAQLNVYLNV